MIKPSEIIRLKNTQKELLRKRKRGNSSMIDGSQTDLYQIDIGILDFYKRMKDCLTGEDENVSMLVRLYDEDYVRKVKHDLAFQNSVLVDKYYQPEK